MQEGKRQSITARPCYCQAYRSHPSSVLNPGCHMGTLIVEGSNRFQPKVDEAFGEARRNRPGRASCVEVQCGANSSGR